MFLKNLICIMTQSYQSNFTCFIKNTSLILNIIIWKRKRNKKANPNPKNTYNIEHHCIVSSLYYGIGVKDLFRPVHHDLLLVIIGILSCFSISFVWKPLTGILSAALYLGCNTMVLQHCKYHCQFFCTAQRSSELLNKDIPICLSFLTTFEGTDGTYCIFTMNKSIMMVGCTPCN